MSTIAYESLEEIERAFKRRLADASDEELPAVKLELSETKNAFLVSHSKAAELKSAKMEALAEFPRAKELEDMISGNTPDEIKATAKKIHERLEALAPVAPPPPAPDPTEAARQAYGSPAAGGGTPVQHTAPQEALEKEVRGILERGDAVPPVTQRRFQNNRIREAVEFSKKTPTYKS